MVCNRLIARGRSAPARWVGNIVSGVLVPLNADGTSHDTNASRHGKTIICEETPIDGVDTCRSRLTFSGGEPQTADDLRIRVANISTEIDVVSSPWCWPETCFSKTGS